MATPAAWVQCQQQAGGTIKKGTALPTGHNFSYPEDAMDSTERLKETAADCYLLSEDFSDPGARSRLMELARQFRQIADHVRPAHSTIQDTASSRRQSRIQ